MNRKIIIIGVRSNFSNYLNKYIDGCTLISTKDVDNLEEKIKTAVIWHKSTSKFKPDYYVDYLEDSPWIHMPFEKYETTNIKDFKFE